MSIATLTKTKPAAVVKQLATPIDTTSTTMAKMAQPTYLDGFDTFLARTSVAKNNVLECQWELVQFLLSRRPSPISQHDVQMCFAQAEAEAKNRGLGTSPKRSHQVADMVEDSDDEEESKPIQAKGSKKSKGNADGVDKAASKRTTPVKVTGMNVFSMAMFAAISKQGFRGTRVLAEVTFRWMFFSKEQKALWEMWALVVNMHHDEKRAEVEADTTVAPDKRTKALNNMWKSLDEEEKQAYVVEYEKANKVTVTPPPDMVERFEGAVCPNVYMGVQLDVVQYGTGKNAGVPFTLKERADERYADKMEGIAKAAAAAEAQAAADAKSQPAAEAEAETEEPTEAEAAAKAAKAAKKSAKK